jgi:type II secretory pathway component GspD/PulD (secretin)
MYESNSLAKVVSSQTSVIKSGEKLVLGINDNKNIIIYKENQISTREIKTGINIEVVPKLFKGKIEAEILSNISKLTNQQNDTYDTSASSLKTKVSLSPNEYMLIADLDLQNLLEKEGSYAFTKYIPIVRRFFSDDSSDYSNKRLLIYLNAVPQKVGDAK